MSACPKCGSPTQPSDKFCNSCGFALAGAAPSPSPFGVPPPAPFGAPGAPQAPSGSGSAYGPPPGAPPPPPPPPPPMGYGAPGAPAGPARCAQGHEIPAGQSYCREGHPLALDAMSFGSDAYGNPSGQGGYGAQPPLPPSPFGGPSPYGVPQPPPAYGAPPASPFVGQPPGFGMPPPPPPGPPAQQGYGYPPPGGQPFGDVPPPPPPGQAFGGAPGGYPPPPPPPGYGPPQHGAPFGAPPPPNRGAYATGLPANALRGFLVSFQSNAQGDFWPLHGGRLLLGRANAAEGLDIPLADATISSRHASLTIDVASGSIVVEDNGSTNGTYVNDEHIGQNGRRELRDGDRLRLGGYTTIVKILGPI
ncbi:FHA domain-containing protein [Pendulispora albinea]|uniref:FHA domain-containing protein n=1 Tax=Pendulispora albinea TaxID=2741071 RepID=A0ABZ2M536_9BACT